MGKKVICAVIALGLVCGSAWFLHALTNNKIDIGYNKGYQPTQPIPFSHKLHAGQYQINCKYCHTATEVSRHAAVPSLNICMNCHIMIKNDSEWIQKIAEAYSNNEPVQWKKVHLLPDHVKFNHSAHVLAGKECTTCHGQIQEMETVEQINSLSMGWCVNCHRKPENNAPVSCGTCHY